MRYLSLWLKMDNSIFFKCLFFHLKLKCKLSLVMFLTHYIIVDTKYYPKKIILKHWFYFQQPSALHMQLLMLTTKVHPTIHLQNRTSKNVGQDLQAKLCKHYLRPVDAALSHRSKVNSFDLTILTSSLQSPNSMRGTRSMSMTYFDKRIYIYSGECKSWCLVDDGWLSMCVCVFRECATFTCGSDDGVRSE